ncbi:MAG TPA: sulfotransferase [Mycobacteriales bacterium]
MALPDFLLVGAPKAGTTALHVALARHRQLYLSPVKEPKFFLTGGEPPRGPGGPGDAQTYREYVWRREDYERLFDVAPPGTLTGESTTLYLRDPAAHERIAATLPAARLVAVIRDPVDRAHSNWTHLRSAGLEPEVDFLRACALEESRAARGWGPFWRYVDLGRYGAQLAHLFSVFPREQVLVVLYRDLRRDPAGTLDRICAFLGVATGIVRSVPAENVTAAAAGSGPDRLLGRVLPALARLPGRTGDRAVRAVRRRLQREQRQRTPLTPAERAALLPSFLDDIALLESATGLRVDHWRALDAHQRPPLDIRGNIGTAHTDIDRPL